MPEYKKVETLRAIQYLTGRMGLWDYNSWHYFANSYLFFYLKFIF